MKKFLFFLIPVGIFLVFSMFSSNLFLSGNINPATFVLVSAGFMIILALMRPKSGNTTKTPEAVQAMLGEFSEGAFASDEQLRGKFNAAMNDYASNLPKAALNKLAKLETQCSGDKERYAVAMLTALSQSTVGNYEEAIRQYNKAIVLHPTAALAVTIGSAQQRLGKLKEAIDSYEFALDMDPAHVDAMSSLATAYVAKGNYSAALDMAERALELNENHSSSLATAAICYGVQDDVLMYRHYTTKAVENGYSENKIRSTVDALKKRK